MSQIDITQRLEPQGPFDVIVHKLSDVMVEAERDSRAQQLLASFQVGLARVSLGRTNTNVSLRSLVPHICRCRATCPPTLRRFSWTLCPP